MNFGKTIYPLIWAFIMPFTLNAHQPQGELHYLANEGVMATTLDTKVLFDPFFHNDYQTYALVPQTIRDAIFNGEKPYDNIDFVFISHAHGDHFSAEDLLRYLKKHPKVQLVAPQQAIDTIARLKHSLLILNRTHAIDLDFGDPVLEFNIQDISIQAIRIPHAGWPGRKEVENIVYRVKLDDTMSVMHMGDADVNPQHYRPYQLTFDQNRTDINFPPYWFLTSDVGNMILNDMIKATKNIGVHVPIQVPENLIKSGKDFFSKPGEFRVFKAKEMHSDNQEFKSHK